MARRSLGPRFDSVLKTIFLEDSPSLLSDLTGGRRVLEAVNPELPKVSGLRADLVLRLDDESLLHVEFNTRNQPMAARMLDYYAGLYRRYRRPIRQALIHVGRAKMNIGPNTLDLPGLRLEFRALDVRDIDAERLIASGSPGDLALAILARGGDRRFREILDRAVRLPKGSDRTKLLNEIAILADLRRIGEIVESEVRAMTETIKIRPGSLLEEWREDAIEVGRQEGLARGLERGIERGSREGQATLLLRLIEARFAKIPDWARRRVLSADSQSLTRWADRILTADSLEGVLGKRYA